MPLLFLCIKFSKNDKILLTNDNFSVIIKMKIIHMEEIFMWNKEKSVKLTHFMVRIFYLILTVVAAASVIIPITVRDYEPLAF